uniref:Uncharacterized protein n=1 Tax=Globisporangium ultimum (strain ATCC 200006 / CBS 805.95 / DAOM BR144) TaxID=431595 RepID=K3W8N5_GLOUD
MASNAFANASLLNAKNPALASFDRFLEKHQVARSNVHGLITQDPTGHVLSSTLDQYALYLVAAEGAREKRLAKNMVAQYFDLVKAWLL